MRGAYLGQFELHAMLAVLQQGNEAYGLEIQNKLKAETGRRNTLGAIYVTLSRLEVKGLVESRLGDHQSDQMGRPRRYFSVTGAGVRAIHESREALRKLTGGLDPGLAGTASWCSLRSRTQP